MKRKKKKLKSNSGIFKKVSGQQLAKIQEISLRNSGGGDTL